MMKPTVKLLLALAAILPVHSVAQDASRICGVERKNQLEERITLQVVCDQYAPETKAERLLRLEALRADNPECYDAILSNPEMRQFIELFPRLIAENRFAAAITPEGRAYEAGLVNFYSRQCASLVSETSGADPADGR